MNKKRILQVLRIIILIFVVSGATSAIYYWQHEMPMKAVLFGMSAAIIVFNLIIATVLVNKNIK